MPTADLIPPPDRERSPWIAVVGPPGSGGEVVARAVGALGLGQVGAQQPPPVPHSASDGPRATTALSTASDRLLALLEGTWWAPPMVSTGWEERPELVEAAPPVIGTLEHALGAARSPESTGGPIASPGIWFDPRHVLLLPFWRTHHRGLRAAIVTWRSPGATVADLAGQGIGPLHALALWEVQLETALQAARGLPILGVDVDRAVTDEDGFAATATRFLTELGIATPDDGAARTAGALQASAALLTDPNLPADPEEAISAARMAAWLSSATGVHHRWDPPSDLAAGRWAHALLDAHLASYRSARSAADAWMEAEEAYGRAASADVDATSSVAALDWTVDRLVDAWASGRLTDGGPPTLPD